MHGVEHNGTALIVTTISKPNAVLKELSCNSKTNGIKFIVIGDSKSPPDFKLDECDYWSIERQLRSPFKYAKKCPTCHYARKNIGYLAAIADHAAVIIETDDDNFPNAEFWEIRNSFVKAKIFDNLSWVNVYKYFINEKIWPRGFPLSLVNRFSPDYALQKTEEVYAPIQQGLADANPDVDAIYRLLFDLPVFFKREAPVALVNGSICPFNSQNTTWFKPAFPLLYLPAYCSFRMTDIWRSFVAWRIALQNKWAITFHSATVHQERNDHDLMKDFVEEVPGYLNNQAIIQCLMDANVLGGENNMHGDLLTCYQELVGKGYLPSEEIDLVEAWLEDI